MHKNELLSFQMKINLAKNKRKIFQKKSVEYYLQNKEAIKEKSKNWYKNLSKEEKYKMTEYQRKRYQELIQYKKRAWRYKNEWKDTKIWQY